VEVRGWTQEEIDYVLRRAPHTSRNALIKEMGKDRNQTDNLIRRLGLKFGYQENRRQWTPETDQILIDNYWDMTPQAMADMIGNISETAVKHRLKVLGLILPLERIAERVRTTRIQKGNIPWNKGLHYPSHPNMVPTQFKKGQKPHNTRYEGHVSFRIDKNLNRWYCHIQKNGRYIHLQRYVWEEANGPIPKGMIIRFKNGNSLDCRLCNLELISRREHVLRNQNRAKAGESMKRYWAKGASDKHIAAMITKDEAVREAIANNPEIIELKKLQLQLTKAMKNGKKLNRASA